jgi:hypothetical protein
MDISNLITGGLSIAASVVIYLTSASRSRTNEQFGLLKNELTEVKESIRAGDEAEERRRTEALRDLDARTSRSIGDLRDEMTRRFDDLKSAVLTVVSNR